MAELTTSYTPPIGAEGRPARPSIVTPLEEMRLNLYNAARRDLDERGWLPATLINLHPWQLYGNGVLAPIRELRVPGVPRDLDNWKLAKKVKLKSGAEIPYVKHVFRHPDITVLEQVLGPEMSAVGNTSTMVTMPMRFVEDMYQQNNNPIERGGVFGYVGDHDPLSDRKSPEYEKEVERLEREHARQIMHYNQVLEQATAAHAEKNIHKIKEIQQYPRWIARYLRNLGLLASDPEWLTAAVKVGPAVTQNCVCGAETKAAAVICKDCNYVLLPYEAFERQVIDLETAGAKLVLKRMTTEQIAKLIAMGRFSLDDLEEIGFVADKGAKGKKAKEKEPVAQ